MRDGCDESGPPMRDFLPPDRPALVLAPMQDVTDLPFMRVLARRGAPDWFVTEYFRIYPGAHLSRYILRSIVENETGKPIYAQMIGRDLPSLIHSANELAQTPIAGIDLNLGCPAPIVCRKDAGGGLLRNLVTLNELIGRLREAIPGRFTVKTRLGYTTVDEFPALLEIFRRYGIDGLTIHARTVLERYQTPVHPDFVKSAVSVMDCPVIANGNVVDTATGLAYLAQTGAAGLMIGRGAIRNPWIFTQFREVFAGSDTTAPTYRDLWEYVIELYDELARETPKFNPLSHVQRMKKTLAYISHGLEGEFEYDMRRAKLPIEFQEICRNHLDHPTRLPSQPPLGSKLFCGFETLR
jgi:tRNA-dihydrouridine synthase